MMGWLPRTTARRRIAGAASRDPTIPGKIQSQKPTITYTQYLKIIASPTQHSGRQILNPIISIFFMSRCTIIEPPGLKNLTHTFKVGWVWLAGGWYYAGTTTTSTNRQATEIVRNIYLNQRIPKGILSLFHNSAVVNNILYCHEVRIF